MNMRQKLLPIFIAEAEKNLKLLKRFLQQGDGIISDPDVLESAFRAAHTIKGTAKLVEADAIYRIARRLEALFDRHAAARTVPTAVECEAMQLTIDWIYQLLEALKGQQPQAKTLVDEALQALDLAERYPDAARLTELLDNAQLPPSVSSEDPFNDDPDVVSLEAPLLPEDDPFADDPGFGLELDATTGIFGAPGEKDESDTALAAEHDPALTNIDESAPLLAEFFSTGPPEIQETQTEMAAEPVFDPFSEDLDYSGVDAQVDSEHQGVAPPTKKYQPVTEPDAGGDSDHQEVVTAPAHRQSLLSTAAIPDPFADDPDDHGSQGEFPAVLKNSTDQSGIAQRQDSAPSGRIESDTPEARVADSLLLGDDEHLPQPEYVACNFEFAGHAYSLPINQMLEIAELPALLPLPLAPPLVGGLVNLRGRVMPVIDLSELNPGKVPVDATRRLVVGEYRGEQVAFLAEGIPLLAAEETGEKIDLAVFLDKYRISGVME